MNSLSNVHRLPLHLVGTLACSRAGATAAARAACRGRGIHLQRSSVAPWTGPGPTCRTTKGYWDWFPLPASRLAAGHSSRYAREQAAASVHCSAAVRAREAEDDDDDAPEEDLRIPWGDAFEVRMVEMIAESKALEDELCTNPPADRQAKIGRRLASLSKVRALGEELQVVTAELQDLVAVADDDGEDAATRSEFRAEADRVAAQQAALRDQLVMQLLPKDEDDDLGAIVEVRAAAGGLEASLFAGEVFAMYQKFALRKGWRWEQLAVSESEAGGLREASAAVSGTGVFGVLKYESGVHRVQRVPVTEGAGRVHTSTVSVAIIPDAETADFEVRDADLKIEVMRASGAGGQSVNTTESAVRIVHLPTGLEVKCADERSQHKNKAKALKILASRIYDAHKQKEAQEASAFRKALIGSGDRSERIRTFNYAQDRVTDHRVRRSVFGVAGFLAGSELLDDMVAVLHRHEANLRVQDMK